MQRISKPLAALALVIGFTATAPAFAGNYAEGDPRPQTRTAHESAINVANETRAWLRSAPTLGYPEGCACVAPQVSQKSRDMVRAEAQAWVASGMAQIAYGEVGHDSIGPSFTRAAQSFSSLRADLDVPRAQ